MQSKPFHILSRHISFSAAVMYEHKRVHLAALSESYFAHTHTQLLCFCSFSTALHFFCSSTPIEGQITEYIFLPCIVLMNIYEKCIIKWERADRSRGVAGPAGEHASVGVRSFRAVRCSDGRIKGWCGITLLTAEPGLTVGTPPAPFTDQPCPSHIRSYDDLKRLRSNNSVGGMQNIQS